MSKSVGPGRIVGVGTTQDEPSHEDGELQKNSHCALVLVSLCREVVFTDTELSPGWKLALVPGKAEQLPTTGELVTAINALPTPVPPGPEQDNL